MLRQDVREGTCDLGDERDASGERPGADAEESSAGFIEGGEGLSDDLDDDVKRSAAGNGETDGNEDLAESADLGFELSRRRVSAS